MRLNMQRNEHQKKGLIGSRMVYTLDAQLDIAEEEKSIVKRHDISPLLAEFPEGLPLVKRTPRGWGSNLYYYGLEKGEQYESDDLEIIDSIEKTIADSCKEFAARVKRHQAGSQRDESIEL